MFYKLTHRVVELYAIDHSRLGARHHLQDGRRSSTRAGHQQLLLTPALLGKQFLRGLLHLSPERQSRQQVLHTFEVAPGALQPLRLQIRPHALHNFCGAEAFWGLLVLLFMRIFRGSMTAINEKTTRPALGESVARTTHFHAVSASPFKGSAPFLAAYPFNLQR